MYLVLHPSIHVVLHTWLRIVRKDDLGFLAVMVNPPKTITKRNPCHFWNALVMVHNVKRIWIENWDNLFGLSRRKSWPPNIIHLWICRFPFHFHVAFLSIFWHAHSWSLLFLATLCKLEWHCHSFLNQWKNLENSGLDHYSPQLIILISACFSYLELWRAIAAYSRVQLLVMKVL